MKKKVFNISRKSLALTLALALVVGIVFMIPTFAAADTSAMGALIDSFTANSSIFNLTTSSRFFLETEPTEEVKKTVQLAQTQFAEDRLPSEAVLDIVYGNTNMVRPGDILIKMVGSDDTSFGAEGYKLEVTTFAVVTAKDVRGLMYGLNMLQKHFRNAGSTSIKGFTAIDTPDTKERTVQLDCARKYLSVNYICNFIKEMAWMGYNSLQLHFSEDGGFRADFWDPAYYQGVFQPQNDFSWLCGSATQYWCYEYTSYDGTKVNYANDPDAGRSLTTAELKQIVDCCKTYNIDIIPSFDSPGHMDYLTWRFEKYHLSTSGGFSFKYGEIDYTSSAVSGIINYYGTGGASKPDGRRYTCIDVNDDTIRGQTAQAFVLSIYKDIADFFKQYAGSTKFNIGADEIVLNANTSWQYDKFAPYINKVNALLEGRGYQCRMFNDFITADALALLDDDIEILYWNTPFNTTASSVSAATNYYKVNYKYNTNGTALYNAPMQTVANYVADNRTVYNCVNQHTYYVLRVNSNSNGGDARSKSCRTWEFYGSDEVSIYNNWAPNNISKKGDQKEPDVFVESEDLGGAYFLTWHDYAAVNTETEVWRGVTDFMKNTKEFYSIRYRMWSNSIKMWNWDINGSLSYEDFALLRETLGDFPGLKSDTFAGATRALATSLPTATEPIALADHTELTDALATKIEQGYYTTASYNAYLAAYQAAVNVNNDNSATAEQIGTALANLNRARKNLKITTNSFTVKYMTTIDNQSQEIASTVYEVPVNESTIELFIPALDGYKYLSVASDDENYTPTFVLSDSGDGSGYLKGPAISDITYTIWYENVVDTCRLNDLIEEALTDEDNAKFKFTHASWTTYTTALRNARNFTLTATTTQSDVDALVQALTDARTGLIVDCDETTITVEKVNGAFLSTEQIGLHIYTTPDVASLTITNQNGEVQTLDYCTGEVQQLITGETVKYWLAFFTPAAADLPEDATTVDLTYTVSYRTTSDEITVTVAIPE